MEAPKPLMEAKVLVRRAFMPLRTRLLNYHRGNQQRVSDEPAMKRLMNHWPAWQR